MGDGVYLVAMHELGSSINCEGGEGKDPSGI
jgi:hypothetical protein